MNLIDIRELTVKYGSTEALKKASLQLKPGRIVGLLGPNGSGKTTLLKVLAGVLKDYQGLVRLNGQPLDDSTKEWVSFLPDRLFLDKNCSAEEIFTDYRFWFKDFNLTKAEEMLDFFEIRKTQQLSQMSKGMQEKVHIAVIMGRDAKIYLLDEPLSGVDPASRKIILDTIIRNFSENALMLMATHQVRESEYIMDEAIFLRKGEIVLHDSSDLLREQYSRSLEEIFTEVYSCSGNW